MVIKKFSRRDIMKGVAATSMFGNVSLLTGAGLIGGKSAAGQALQTGPGGDGRLMDGWEENPPHTRKVLIAWGDHQGVGHSSTSHAQSVPKRIGYEAGTYDTFILSDSAMIKYTTPPTNPGQRTNQGLLDVAHCIFFNGQRAVNLSDEGKVDLMKWVRSGGGFVASHQALTAFSEEWPEFEEMIGGFFFGHPWSGHDALGHIINEDPEFPATKFMPPQFYFDDEYYGVKNLDRKKTRVVLRMDVSELPARHAFMGKDNDLPIAWAKMHGKGRVFYSQFGHSNGVWDHTDVQRHYFEAIKWAMGLTNTDLTPLPLPKGLKGPSTPPATTPAPNSHPGWGDDPPGGIIL
jgi:type 1 glutamine amidotransferase